MNDKLSRWTEKHALLMGLAIVGAILEKSTFPVAAMAGGSFLGFVLNFSGHWKTKGGFGLANTITMMRTLATLGLLLADDMNPWTQTGVILALVCADGLDGWAARRFDTTSEFGQLFDQESDALLLLVICLLLFVSGRLGIWVILPGALRYGFILFRQLAKPPARLIRGNWFTRFIGVAATLTLAGCLFPPFSPELAAGLAILATVSLSASFLYSIRLLYEPVQST